MAADPETQALRDLLKRELPNAGLDFTVAVASGGEVLEYYPHVRVMHGGQLQDEVGYRRRWFIIFRYDYPQDATDQAYALEDAVLRILWAGHPDHPTWGNRVLPAGAVTPLRTISIGKGRKLSNRVTVDGL